MISHANVGANERSRAWVRGRAGAGAWRGGARRAARERAGAQAWGAEAREHGMAGARVRWSEMRESTGAQELLGVQARGHAYGRAQTRAKTRTCAQA